MSKDNNEILVLVFGILSLVGNFALIGGIVFAILAFVFYSRIKGEKPQEAKIGFWLAVAGVILNMIGLFIGTIFFFFTVGVPILSALANV